MQVKAELLHYPLPPNVKSEWLHYLTPKVKAEWLHYPTRMAALPHPSQKCQSPATCPVHTASSAISTILPRPCGGGPTRRLDGGPQSTPLGGTQSTHDATVPTSSGCITPHADGFITPSFRWLLVSHDVPPGSLVKTPAPSRQPLSENEGGSIIPPQGKSRVAALPHT